jgi:hypothetical protein
MVTLACWARAIDSFNVFGVISLHLFGEGHDVFLGLERCKRLDWIQTAAENATVTGAGSERKRKWPSSPSTVFSARSLYFPVRGSDFVVSPQKFSLFKLRGNFGTSS